ncbi:unnamed protein product [Discula destructiva]
MTATNGTVYVVTGANRGLGLGLVRTLLSRPNTVIIATVRSQEAVASLIHATNGPGIDSHCDLRTIQLDFTHAPTPEEIRKAITSELVDIDHVDVLINNAGAPQPMVPASQTSAADLRAAFEVNTIAPLMVFQGVWPLLQKSPTGTPKAVWITSSVGSIAEMEPMSGGAYGPSKAAQNWLTRAIHLENKDTGLIALALHPGWVQTRAGKFAADEWGFAGGPPDTVESSVEGILKIIDGATKDDSGKFLTQNGVVVGW